MALNIYFPDDIARTLESLKSASDEFEDKEKRRAYQKALRDVGLAFGVMLYCGYVSTQYEG